MKTVEQKFGPLKALVLEPKQKATKAIILLHGVGSNDSNMLDLGPALSEDRLIVSLRAPIDLGPNAYAWFHVRFTEQGPVHNWEEAQSSLGMIEKAIHSVSESYKIPLDRIAVLGFSQGAIMTIGLSLASELNLEEYVASSGRTLLEWSKASEDSPLKSYAKRKIFVSHGVQDSKLPIALARNSESVLKRARLQLTYKEYEYDHGLSAAMVTDIKKWLLHP